MSDSLVCHNEGCLVATTGNCLEGFSPPDECPYLGGEASTDNESTSRQNTFFALPSGKAMTVLEANRVASDAQTKLIFVVGDRDSGKTTLLTSIYESFQDAPFAGFQFAGSRTLPGWEERAFLGRVNSGNSEPDTVRTKIGEGIKFLHLQLTSQKKPVPFDLLFADISGELYKQLRDSDTALKTLGVLHRADVVCVVLDGERLIQDDEKFLSRNNVRLLLRSVFQSNILSINCRVAVVISKWDAIVSCSNADKVIAFAEDTLAGYRQEFPQITCNTMAARPRVKLKFAHGVATLLREWCEDKHVDNGPLPSIHNSNRHFDRYGNLGGQK